MVRSDWTPSRIIGVIAYGIIGICLVVLFISDARQDQFDARRSADIAAARAETVHCIQKVLDKQLKGTDTLREASKIRADADYEIKRLAIAEGIPLSDWRVREAWDKYAQAHTRYNQSLKQNPLPDIETCR